MTATVYTVGNFKGGVGKTKIVTMLGYDNAFLRNKKTLVIDLDPQANASQILAKTFNIENIENTITNGISEGNLSNCITHLSENLDLIACDTSFRSFTKYAIQSFNTEDEQVRILDNLLKPIRPIYDAIFIDVPPTISEFSDNAMAASNYSIIAFQTQEESLDGISKYVGYQNFMVERYGIDLQVLGIIACMLEPDDNIDIEVLEEAKEMYGTAVLDTIITYQKRLKRYSREGIYLKKYKNGNFDQWDYNAHNIFVKILDELDNRQAFLDMEVTE